MGYFYLSIYEGVVNDKHSRRFLSTPYYESSVVTFEEPLLLDNSENDQIGNDPIGIFRRIAVISKECAA
jgi:hypothetical protein